VAKKEYTLYFVQYLSKLVGRYKEFFIKKVSAQGRDPTTLF